MVGSVPISAPAGRCVVGGELDDGGHNPPPGRRAILAAADREHGLGRFSLWALLGASGGRPVMPANGGGGARL
jgi:hypothetical protein